MNFRNTLLLVFITILFSSFSYAAVRVKRSFEVTKDNEIMVTLSISKRGVAGVAKLVETISGPFIAKEKESLDALFSYDHSSKEITFTWSAISLEDKIEISYILISPEAYEGNSSYVSGQFHYVEEGSSKTFNIMKETINLTLNAQEITKTTEVKKIPLTFAVQIAAGKTEIDTVTKYFRSLYNIEDTVLVEKVGDINKYYVGSFTDYFKASAYKENLTSKGAFGAYVIAFNDGVRISVAKALILQQQAIQQVELNAKATEEKSSSDTLQIEP